MTEPLEILLASVDADCPLFTAAELARWPEGAVHRLKDIGLLQPTDSATHVVCPNCGEGHVEEIMVCEGPDGKWRAFISCPEALRVEVPDDLLRQWTIDIDALTKLLADGLRLKGRPKELVAGRLWRLGKTPWQGANREVLFARGLSWADASRVTCHVGPNGRPIILVADKPPDDAAWRGTPPATVPLSLIVSLDDKGLEVDATDLAAWVNEADQRIAAVLAVPVTGAERKLLIRRQIKAVVKSFLKDDELTAAYAQHGSYRKAAEALSQERGTSISKDMIRRAVLRQGGGGAAARTEDSESVHRNVASHRRNRRRIFPRHTELPDS